MTITRTVTYVTPPGTDLTFPLTHNTDQDESDMLFHGKELVAYLVRDEDCASPQENDGEGKIYTPYAEESQHKYAVLLDVYEHGGIEYSLFGEGTQCRFDTRKAMWVPDVLAIENFEDKSLTLEENRIKAREYAKSCLESYNAWIAGDCWGVIVEKLGGEEIEAVWGHIGLDNAKAAMKEMFEEAIK